MGNVKQIRKKYPVHIRLWHWLNALVISGSLITVLLNSTLLDVRENGSYIQAELEKAGANVSAAQARTVSHGLEDKVWELHIYFGYALAALLLYRIGFELFRTKESGFFTILKAKLRLYFTQKVAVNRHELGVKLLYLLFYTVFLLMVITGLSIAFDQELGLTKSFSHTLKEIHGFCMYIVLAFIVLHLGGVYFAERKDKAGITSDMINGGNLNE